jgi:hypothetical protein
MNMPGFTAETGLYKHMRPFTGRGYDDSAASNGRTVRPAQVLQGCFWNYFDCDGYGLYGVYNGWWNAYICDNRYCNYTGFGLVTF